jgi:hypothetical protein
LTGPADKEAANAQASTSTRRTRPPIQAFLAAIDAAMKDLDWNGWAIVEQAIFPLDDPDRPLPIATRTRHYFNTLGWTTRCHRPRGSMTG